jgi:hypothetical protein
MLMALSYRQILKTWWPLAFSWLLMSVEIPMLSAVIARLDHPEINLAAYGGIVYPLALIIESPVIMLLAASVALCKHQQAYNLVWRYMMAAGFLLTGLHALVAFSPLYYIVVEKLIGVPKEIIEPARVGMMLMLPWTWAISYRRFQQGVLIRFGYSGAVGVGTLVRLASLGVVLAVGYQSHMLPGVALGALAQALAVISEAVYAGIRVRPVILHELRQAQVSERLTWRGFADFYVPLALTSLISLLWQPVGSAALSRMPGALNSLATWPVVSGLVSLLRSFGVAYNEAVVALLDKENAWRSLRRFTAWMAAVTTALHLLLAATPLAEIYFAWFSALPGDLVGLAKNGFWLALPMPALAVLQSWFQGAILVGRRTRGVPESVGVFFAAALLALGAGVTAGQWTGLYVGIVGFVLASLAQMAWLWLRSRLVMERLMLVCHDLPISA